MNRPVLITCNEILLFVHGIQTLGLSFGLHINQCFVSRVRHCHLRHHGDGLGPTVCLT